MKSRCFCFWIYRREKTIKDIEKEKNIIYNIHKENAEGTKDERKK